MRRTGPEPADAYGHPAGGTYTLGVGAAVAAIHDPSTHGLPEGRNSRGARARLVQVKKKKKEKNRRVPLGSS